MTAQLRTDRRRETQGLALGLLGVVIFAMTLPMTRLAVGPAIDPQLPPAFVTAGRAACAGVLAAIYLLLVRAPWPVREQRPALCGLVIGFAAWQGGGALVLADALLLGSVASAAIGYVAGARLSAAMPAERVICWVPVLGERLDAATLGFALAVVATVFVGRAMPVGRPAAAPISPSCTTRPT